MPVHDFGEDVRHGFLGEGVNSDGVHVSEEALRYHVAPSTLKHTR